MDSRSIHELGTANWIAGPRDGNFDFAALLVLPDRNSCMDKEEQLGGVPARLGKSSAWAEARAHKRKTRRLLPGIANRFS